LPRTPESTKRYTWLSQASGAPLQVSGTIETRFPPPPDYTRVRVEPGSFAEWLRGLPLAPEGSEVVRYDSAVVRPADDPYVAAIVAIDIGSADLQQSADVLIRLHAEWLWSQGKHAAINYPGATKLAMPLSRWEKGQRLISQGANVYWAVQTKPQAADYKEFRRYLDAVFAWANSSSLSRSTKPIEKPEDAAPGDFFLHTKPPGHVAILLDIAEKPSGERVALLGQALSPTESVHVIRPGRATAWFSLRPQQPIVTARSAEFNWNELRRLKGFETDNEEADSSKPESEGAKTEGAPAPGVKK
jgi:hypothetical protein